MGSHKNRRDIPPIPENIVAGGWIKPTEPPIRVASQAIMPGMPPAQDQKVNFTMSADGQPQQQEKPKNDE